MSTLTNLFISAYGKKGSKLSKFEDFLIDWDFSALEDKKDQKQSPEEIKKVLMGMLGR